MTTYKMSWRGIFKAVMCFALVTGFCLNGFAKTPYRDMVARKKLVEKYRDYKLIRDRLETLLLIGWSEEKNDHEIKKFFDAPYDIAKEKNPMATEALVDLLDFYIGVPLDDTIIELISLRGKEAIPFLKRKISQKPLSVEQKIYERNRNKIIAELIKAISCGAKYIFSEGYSKEEIVRFYLFYVQMDLEKYYREKGRYPKDLSQTYWTAANRDIAENNMEQKLKYKGFEHIYFLCTLGKDGKFGTKDDVKPPYNTDVFSFPENFKE